MIFDAVEPIDAIQQVEVIADHGKAEDTIKRPHGRSWILCTISIRLEDKVVHPAWKIAMPPLKSCIIERVKGVR